MAYPTCLHSKIARTWQTHRGHTSPPHLAMSKQVRKPAPNIDAPEEGQILSLLLWCAPLPQVACGDGAALSGSSLPCTDRSRVARHDDWAAMAALLLRSAGTGERIASHIKHTHTHTHTRRVHTHTHTHTRRVHTHNIHTHIQTHTQSTQAHTGHTWSMSTTRKLPIADLIHEAASVGQGLPNPGPPACMGFALHCTTSTAVRPHPRPVASLPDHTCGNSYQSCPPAGQGHRHAPAVTHP